MRDFDIPEAVIVARVGGARVIAPSGRSVDMAIDGGGYVAMVDREVFDPWLRDRAEAAGARRYDLTFETLEHDPSGLVTVICSPRRGEGQRVRIRARAVIGADGANSAVARASLGPHARVPFVFAYHEVIRAPAGGTAAYDDRRCDIYYQRPYSPDFYAWVFPHGSTASVGTGSSHKGFALREAVGRLRSEVGLADAETIRREGAPLPLRPLKRWDGGRAVLVVGDAAGLVAPASGEGIYYAMESGRLGAAAVATFWRPATPGRSPERARPS